MILGIACVVGCGHRLSYQNQYTLESGYVQTVTLDPVSVDQTVTIHAVSNGNLFQIHVYLLKDETEAELAIAKQQASDKVIASSASTKDVTLKADIPADQTGIVRLEAASAKDVNVSVEITN